MIQITSRQIQQYRDVFLRSADGREVLWDILNDLYGWATNLEDDEQRILHSAALGLQAKLGILLPGQGLEIIEAWAKIPPPKEQDDNGRT